MVCFDASTLLLGKVLSIVVEFRRTETPPKALIEAAISTCTFPLVQHFPHQAKRGRPTHPRRGSNFFSSSPSLLIHIAIINKAAKKYQGPSPSSETRDKDKSPPYNSRPFPLVHESLEVTRKMPLMDDGFEALLEPFYNGKKLTDPISTKEDKFQLLPAFLKVKGE